MSKIIFLNGTSSSGKTTLAREIKSIASIPFWHFASDQFVEADMLPRRENDGGLFDWRTNRPKFFNAFHLCIKAILDTENDMILDHIIESTGWCDELREILTGHDVFFVGIHCPVEILREREINRSDRDIGNRFVGEAEYHLKSVHSYAHYDFEIDSSEQSAQQTAKMVLSAWSERGATNFFE